MDIQTEVQKIHHQFGVTEKANYEIQKLFDKAIKEAVTEALRKHAVGDSFISKFEEIIYGGLSDSEIVNALHKLDNDRYNEDTRTNI